ncbi:MAG: hypothetical protein QG603_73 [Patescibacteria group bacterium]|nr:hypothetical protein [Patescibacteria group bacterium]
MVCFNGEIGVGIMPDTKVKKEILNKEVLLSFDKKNWNEKKYGSYYKTILLFITNQCNLDCLNCFYRASICRVPDEMSFEYIKKIVDNNPNVDKYDIMGGEPLLHSQLKKIINFLEKNNKKIGLYTNGFLLNRLPLNYKKLKLNIAFHSIDSKDPSRKPLDILATNIKKYQYIYPIKLVFLMDNNNKMMLSEVAEYIENNFDNIDKLTIGAIRNEYDYYNDDYPDVMNLQEYCDIVQNFINNYKGKLNIDIFSEGMLYTENLPRSTKNQINRFRCIYNNNEYSSCLYDIGPNKRIKFDPTKPLKYTDCKYCPKTKKDRCLTDKIKLQHK